MKRKIVLVIILALTLLLIIMNFKVLATSNTSIEQNNAIENVQNDNAENVQNDNEELKYGILDSNEQIIEEVQHLSEAKPRDPKGALIMIIVIITVAIIIVLISWWYKTNY